MSGDEANMPSKAPVIDRSDSGPTPRWALYAGVFLTSIALIMLQVALTRVFSVMIWNHLSFMAITVSLLGFSFAGLLFFFVPAILRAPTWLLVGIGTAGFAVGLYFCGHFILGSRAISEAITASFPADYPDRQRAAATAYLLRLLMYLVIPFFFSGWTISAAIVKEARDVGRVYASNLIGSGVACLAVIGALNHLGAFRTLVAVFCLALLAFACFMVRRKGRLPGLGVLFMLPALALIGFSIKQWAGVPAEARLVQPIPITNKRTDADANTLVRKWNSFSCVDFYPILAEAEGFWGLNRKVYTGKIPENLGVLIDSWALTTIINYTDGLEEDPVFSFVPSSVPYTMFAQRGVEPDVLVIGAGGGIDVLTAKHHKAKSVTAVEINPLIVNGSKRTYPELRDLNKKPGFEAWTNKSVYDLPGVEVHVAEGRHFVDSTDKRFDMIMIPGVDTATGTEAGNFSFSENYLYTVDAMRAYLSKLKDDGLTYVLRFRTTKEHPSEMLRLAAIAEEALRLEGVEDPTKRMLVYFSNVHVFACLVMKKGSDFTPAELQQFHKKLDDLSYSVLFSPDTPDKNEKHFQRYLTSSADERAAMLETYPYRVSPVTDDEPFFFNFTHVSDVFDWKNESKKGLTHLLYYVGQTVLYYCLLAVLALGVLFIGLPLLRFAVKKESIPCRFRFIGYFLCLGFAYITVEIILMQKFVFFLGYPVYAMTVILFSLLTFSGLGSLVSSRIGKGFGLASVFVVLVAAQLGLVFFFEQITDATFHWSFWGRVAVAVAITGPLGFLMGIPFPLGIRYAETHASAMLPWIWSLNGYASVLGSVMSVALAIQTGFTVVLWVAVAIYFVAFLLIASIHRTAGRAR